MSEIFVAGKPGLVENARIYDLYEAVRAAKYAKSIDTNMVNDDLTNGIRTLAKTPIGEGHDNWLCGIRVAFDLNCTIKMWTEAERYHFFDIVTSQSTMHKITKFDLDVSYIRYTDERMIGIMKELVEQYNADPTPENYLKVLYSNPTGMKLTARITTNYRQLKTIYKQRKDHRLPEWRAFCEWIRSLPHSDLITGEKEE